MAKTRATLPEVVHGICPYQGSGPGTGRTYILWLTIHSFASLGTVSRILRRTTGRTHHLLSRNEEIYLSLLDFHPDDTNIREQFTLALDSRVLLA